MAEPGLDYDRLAADYARHRRVHPGVLRGLIDGAQLTAASRVLEVGCGTGNYLLALREHAGCAVEGIDPSAEMLARLRERAPGAAVRQGRAEAIPAANGAFDLVFSVDVIHHVGDRAAFAREARRVLRPGGFVCAVTDSEEDLRRRVPLTRYFPETLAAEQRRYPPIAALRDELAAAGFQLLPETHAEVSYPLTDIRPFRDRAYSSLHLIGDEAHAAGLARMEADLARGPIAARSLYTLVWGRRPANELE